jgi:hypothetical protein
MGTLTHYSKLIVSISLYMYMTIVLKGCQQPPISNMRPDAHPAEGSCIRWFNRSHTFAITSRANTPAKSLPNTILPPVRNLQFFPNMRPPRPHMTSLCQLPIQWSRLKPTVTHPNSFGVKWRLPHAAKPARLQTLRAPSQPYSPRIPSCDWHGTSMQTA